MNVKEIDWSLYAIIDKAFIGERDLETLTEEIITGGAGIIQYRNKISSTGEFYEEALKIRQVTKRHAIPLIINDRVDIAMAVEAEGVHLGQKDLPWSVAKRISSGNLIIGASVHNLNEFHRAMEAPVDYLGVGTIYPTFSKSEGIEIAGEQIIHQLRPRTHLPIVAIGGINLDNLEPVIQAGADGVAVISALLTAEDVQARARAFIQKIKSVKVQIVKS